MNAFLRTICLLTMVVWVGGLIFFAFILAPTAFHVIGLTPEFGRLIAGTLAILHPVGQVCGVVFLAATIATWYRAEARSRKIYVAQMWLALFMMAATAYVQLNIISAMEKDRTAAGGSIEAAPPENPAKLDFDRLHALSEKVEGTVLFLGLGVILLMGMTQRPSPSSVMA